jgi:histidine triad (HIT) family protein
MPDCFVCRKHAARGALLPGGPIGEDELVIVSHLSPQAPGRDGAAVYLGHLLVGPRRHAPGRAGLSDAEAPAVGWWCSRASRALRDAAGAEHVYAAVIGHGVQHLHIHMLPRYPGTPREYWWDRLDEWPAAPRGGVPEIAALVRDLRGSLSGPAHGG